MPLRNREPSIHIDPALDDLEIRVDRAIGSQALYYAGFDKKEIHSLHLVDDSETYQEQASGLLGNESGHHAVIDIGDEAARWRQGAIQDDDMAKLINSSIFHQLATLADETSRNRTVGSYLSLNFCTSYLSCAATFVSEGLLDTIGIRPGAINFSVSAAAGIYTAIKLGYGVPETMDRQAQKLRNVRQGDGTFDIPEVVSVV